jgi:hypothetical protein
MPAVCLHGVSRKTRNKMNTYYKQDNGTFIPATISSEDAIAILIQSAVTNAVNKVNDIIINAVIARVNDAVSDQNIQGKVIEHLGSMDIHDMVNETVGNAIKDYDYDGVIDNALDGVDIDEMVTEKITDHLDSCSIQVRIN